MQVEQSSQLDINCCTSKQLSSVKGIDCLLADSIIRYRDKHGTLRDLADLWRVRGMDDNRLHTVRQHFHVASDRQRMPIALVARMNSPTGKPTGLTTNDHSHWSFCDKTVADSSTNNSALFSRAMGKSARSSPANCKDASYIVRRTTAASALKTGSKLLTLPKDTVVYTDQQTERHAATASNGTSPNALSPKPSIQITKSPSGNIKFARTTERKSESRALDSSEKPADNHKYISMQALDASTPLWKEMSPKHVNQFCTPLDQSNRRKMTTADVSVLLGRWNEPGTDADKCTPLLQHNVVRHEQDYFVAICAKRSLIESWVKEVNVARDSASSSSNSDETPHCSRRDSTKQVISSASAGENSEASRQREQLVVSRLSINAEGWLRDQRSLPSRAAKNNLANTSALIRHVRSANDGVLAKAVDTLKIDCIAKSAKEPIVSLHKDIVLSNECARALSVFKRNAGNVRVSGQSGRESDAVDANVPIPVYRTPRLFTSKKMLHMLPPSVTCKASRAGDFRCSERLRRARIASDKYRCMDKYPLRADTPIGATNCTEMGRFARFLRLPSDASSNKYRQTRELHRTNRTSDRCRSPTRHDGDPCRVM